ncbi:glycoside hydrolase family 11 protein [Trichoderma velutinum]
MVNFSSILVALVGIGSSLAAPLDESLNVNITERGASDFVLGGHNAVRRSAINYNQDYTTGGDVVYTHSNTGFAVNWSYPNDFVVGVGWSTGGSSPINFSGNFGVGSGVGLLAVYGWSTNPLVEYYIMEDNFAYPSAGTVKGSVTSDGSSYTIWENTRVNEPSIQGTATFNQYISVRNSKRSSGTVTVANHFNAWRSLGMNLGTMNFQVLAVEGWGGQGGVQQSVSN